MTFGNARHFQVFQTSGHPVFTISPLMKSIMNSVLMAVHNIHVNLSAEVATDMNLWQTVPDDCTSHSKVASAKQHFTVQIKLRP